MLHSRSHHLQHPIRPYSPVALIVLCSIADAMFAPVCWRFFTYNVQLTDPAARAYLAAMLCHPLMREWEAAAVAEDQPGSEGPPALTHYDAGAHELGGEARAEGDNTVEAFVAKLLA